MLIHASELIPYDFTGMSILIICGVVLDSWQILSVKCEMGKSISGDTCYSILYGVSGMSILINCDVVLHSWQILSINCEMIKRISADTSF